MNLHDSNFLKENNARHMWHPMAHPADMIAHPPKVLTGAEGVTLTDVDGHKTLDAVGGLWNVNLGYSCDPVKKAIAEQLNELPYYSAFRGTSTGPAIGERELDDGVGGADRGESQSGRGAAGWARAVFDQMKRYGT